MQSPDLTFVQLKIAEIRTAVFFCSNNTILPLPAYIVNAIKTNENHLIWFFISTDWNNKVIGTPVIELEKSVNYTTYL